MDGGASTINFLHGYLTVTVESVRTFDISRVSRPETEFLRYVLIGN